MDEKEKIKKEIWNLHRKADQLRSMHYSIMDSYSTWNKLILAYVTIGSAIIAMLIFAKLSVEAQFWIGILSASIFIVGLIPTTFSFDLKRIERNLASNSWGDWIRSASNFCNVEIESLALSEAINKEKELLDSYKKIMSNSPSIPDAKFNRLKQKHLQKIEISKMLDQKPFMSICSIKKELKAKNKSEE